MPGGAGLQLKTVTIPNFSGLSGNQMAWLNDGVSISTAADLHTISTGDTYQLTVDVAGRGDYISSGFQIQLTNSNLTPFASSNISDPVDDNTFRAVTLSYTVGTNSPFIGQGLRIRLINQAGSNQTNFDNVRLTFTPVSVP